jgi:hypothetical protein
MKPTSTIKARLGIEPNGKVQKFFRDTCEIHMDKYIPMRRGMLAGIKEKGDDYIRYSMPYAHYQYVGILYVDPETGSPFARKGVKKIPTSIPLVHKTTMHEQAGTYWDKRMWSAEKEDVLKEVQDYIDRGGK